MSTVVLQSLAFVRKYYRFTRLLFYRAVHEPLPPHNVAMGFTLGLAFAIGPTFGFQIIPFVVVAIKLRYSKLAGMLLIFVSNPLTIVPIYVTELIIGDFLLGSWVNVDISAFRTALSNSVTEFQFSDLLALGRDTIIAFISGSLFCAVVGGTITYFVSKHIIIRWRRRKRTVGWWTQKPVKLLVEKPVAIVKKPVAMVIKRRRQQKNAQNSAKGE